MGKFFILFLCFFLTCTLGYSQNIFVTWEIYSFHFGKYSEISDNDAKKYIGNKMIFGSNKVKIFRDSCKNVFYQMRTVKTNEYLDFHFGIDGGTLGIDKDDINVVELYCNKAMGAPRLGFIILDEATMISSDRGYFFWMRKVK